MAGRGVRGWRGGRKEQHECWQIEGKQGSGLGAGCVELREFRTRTVRGDATVEL